MLQKTCKPAMLVLSLVMAVFFIGCGIKRYTNVELQKKTVATFPKEYQAIVAPLDSSLIPVRKQIFFLKNDINELKEKLLAGGTNQRVARIDDNIDTLRKEISALSTIRREILNTIEIIYPAYEEPDILPYQGENKGIKEIKKRIIIVTLQDQRAYKSMLENNEKLSESYVYKPIIRDATKQIAMLPDSLKPKIQPLGSPGPAPKITPYNAERPAFVK
jgi:hypothetical protein